MTKIKILVFLLLCLVILISGARASVRNEILIINSYSPDYQWSNHIIDSISLELRSSYPETEINIEYLSTERFVSPESWVGRIDMLLENYQDRQPLAVVLISDEAWMAYRAACKNSFKKVPLFLCAVKPLSITIENYIANYKILELSDFTPTIDVMKEFGASGVLREVNVAKSMQLMANTLPGIDSYTVVTDNRFYGIYVRLRVEQYLKQQKGSLPATYIDARFMNTDSLLWKLQAITPTTGVLMTSWLTGVTGYEYSKQYIYKEMSAVLTVPIYITNDIGLSTGNFLGGYYVNSSYWGKQVGEMLVKSLDGMRCTAITPELHLENQCNINWKVLTKFALSKNNFPPYTHYVNYPESIFIKFSRELAIIGILLVIVLLIFSYIVRSNIKLKRAYKLADTAVKDVRDTNQHLLNTQQQLKVALSNAEAADRLKSAFITNMDQEIRTPLNSIVGFSSLIASMDDKKEIEEAAIQISENSEKLLKLVKGILDLSLLESGSAVFEYEKVNIDGMILDLINLCKQRVSQGVILKFVPPERSIDIVTESYRVSQVLFNMMDNALKYTSQGVIEIGYFAQDDYVEIYVKDTGIGVCAEELSRVFDRFYKSDSYVLGPGLGLSISRRIVETLGGQIGASSELGVGSRFWFRIKRDGL